MSPVRVVCVCVGVDEGSAGRGAGGEKGRRVDQLEAAH